MKAGEPHAEIHAIRMAGEQARGGTIYVTLEPCSHHGRTGPCAEAIVQAGIKKVVVATLDPNPLVSGRGIKILQDAGIEVLVGVCEEESKKMNEVFNKYILTKRPFITIKSGVTLDGKIATSLSDSKWITSTEARQEVHQIRNENAAILVGANTVQKDNPSLTTRIPNGRNPIRVILTQHYAYQWKLTLLQMEKLLPGYLQQVIMQRKKKALENAGVKIFVTSGEKHINLYEMLDVLGGKEFPPA